MFSWVGCRRLQADSRRSYEFYSRLLYPPDDLELDAEVKEKPIRRFMSRIKNFQSNTSFMYTCSAGDPPVWMKSTFSFL